MSDKNKIVFIIDRRQRELRTEVNGRIVSFVWDVTGIAKGRIMRDGEVVGTSNPEIEIQERW